MSKLVELEILVDTGSTYTWIRSERLKEIGIRPMDKRRFKTIEGKIIEREIGEANVSVGRQQLK